MKKIISYIICFVLFFNIFTVNGTNIKSNSEEYVWQKVICYTGRDLKGIAYSGNLYVVVGDKGTILTSREGIYWEKVLCGYEDNFYKVIWTGTEFEITSEENKKLISTNGIEWSLKDNNIKTQKYPVSAIKLNQNVTKNKLYGYVKNNKSLVAVGESGTILIGVKNGQIPLIRLYLSSDSDSINKLANSIILHVGSGQMFFENNCAEEAIPKPVSTIVNKGEIVYVPVESIIKIMGGSFTYDSKTNTACITNKDTLITITIGSRTIKVNGKKKSMELSAEVNNNIVFVPVSLFLELGKQVYVDYKLIVISDIRNIFIKDKDKLVIESLRQLSWKFTGYNSSLSEELISNLTNEGDKLYYKHDYSGARNYYETAVEIENNSNLYYNLGSIFQYLNNFNIAIDYYNKGLMLNSINSQLYQNKGDSLSGLSDYVKANECFDKAYEINPKDIGILISKANIDYYKRDYEKAILGYDELLKDNPNNITVYSNKASAYLQIKKIKESIEWSKKLNDIIPNNFDGFWDKGCLLYTNRKYNDAITNFDSALKLLPEAYLVMEKKGDALWNLNKYDQAVLEYKKAIDLNFNTVSFNKKSLNLFTTFFNIDDLTTKYYKAYEKGEYQSYYHKLLIKMAELLCTQKRYVQLVKEFSSIEEVHDTDGYIYYYLALGHCEQGNYDEALKYINLAFKFDKSLCTRFKEDERFDKIKDKVLLN